MEAARRFFLDTREFRIAAQVTRDAVILMFIATVIRLTNIYLTFLFNGDTPVPFHLLEVITQYFILANFVAALLAVTVAEVSGLAHSFGHEFQKGTFRLPTRGSVGRHK